MHYITPYQLTPIHRLESLVEHQTKFSLDFCEMNVFETREKAQDFKLKFEGFTITSMLRGKKIMKLGDEEAFDYLPGETVLAPVNTLLTIDFPEAIESNPTQCTALVIDPDYIQKQLTRINEAHAEQHSPKEWQLDPNELILKNNPRLARLSTRLLQVFSGDDPFKVYETDVVLRDILLCLLRLQSLKKVRASYQKASNSSPFHAVLSYIAQHIHEEIRIETLCKIAGMSKSSFYRSFRDEFGVTPVQLILEERLRYAKKLLKHESLSIKEAAYASGFNDPSYFSRIFRKIEGFSPKSYQLKFRAK